MASEIISVEKRTVAAGKKTAGQVFYVAHVMIGDMLGMRAAKFAIFMTGNEHADKRLQEFWDTAIATKQFIPIDLRYVIVGDTSSNPNELPLPMYRTKNQETGEVSKIAYTQMSVLMRFVDNKPVGSARNQAMRIIEELMEPVVMSNQAPEAGPTEVAPGM